MSSAHYHLIFYFVINVLVCGVKVSAQTTHNKTLEECCQLGEMWSNSYVTSTCENYPYPIGGSNAICLTALHICCVRNFRRKSCEEGLKSARNEQDCTNLPEVGGEAHKDCCEGCKLGLLYRKQGVQCSLPSKDLAIFGSPWDESIYACCMEPISDNEVTRPDPVHDAPQNRCLYHNAGCSQLCIDSGLSVQCACREGYELASDQRTCTDIDECVEGKHTCRYSFQTCLNSPGGFHCIENEQRPNEVNPTTCPVGYIFNSTLQVCDDINECIRGMHNCVLPKVCFNTIGSFACTLSKGSQVGGHSCLAGFKSGDHNDCIDVDECAEKLDDCDPQTEECLNSYGGYSCRPQSLQGGRHCPVGYKWSENTNNCEDVNECQEGLHSCIPNIEECFNIAGGYNCDIRCSSGLLFHPFKRSCIDVDECIERTHNCKDNETCINTYSSFRCVPNSGGSDCPPGHRRSYETRGCIDIDECAEKTDSCSVSDEYCVNTLGSFRCEAKTSYIRCEEGYSPDTDTGTCQDVNECQLGLHLCLSSQRCDNTVGSYTCVRTTGCGTGYTLNAHTGECEDNDECSLGKHNCGQGFVCRNSPGTFRCIRVSCPAGQKLLPDNTCFAVSCSSGMEADTFGNCVDINECLSKRCRSTQFCVNTIGSYRCENLLNCGAGYEIDHSGTQCLDVDECRKGVHECGESQVCRNRQGGYTCECPIGYAISANRKCQDVDECQRFHGQMCSQNSECQNTIGSYYCNCKEGFKKLENSQNCIDVDECSQMPGLCDHTCVNVWGTYQCTCRLGFTLAADNRTCTDIDECSLYKGKGNLCIGICRNTPGSFACSCPSGYKLNNDQRTCQDVNECQEQGVCQGEGQVCLNMRGGFKCNTVVCPAGYVRDKDHKNRCKRSRLDCERSDQSCLQEPLSISFNYLAIASKMRLPPTGQLDLFTMRGPRLSHTSVSFDMKLTSAYLHPSAKEGATPASREDFYLRRTAFNEAVVALVRSLDGPQDVELDLTMKMFHSGLNGGTALAKLYIYVSQYEF